MSFWTDLRDTAEKVATFGLYDPEKSRQADREQRGLIQGQIDAYKEQTRIANEQMNASRESQKAEERKIQEKQIRSLRRNYRSQGILGSGNSSNQADMSAKLGG